MDNPYLTGGELTALTMLYWTSDPLQAGRSQWLELALNGLEERHLAVKFELEELGWRLTAKGQCLMEAINALPEPVNKWVME